MFVCTRSSTIPLLQLRGFKFCSIYSRVLSAWARFKHWFLCAFGAYNMRSNGKGGCGKRLSWKLSVLGFRLWSWLVPSANLKWRMTTRRIKTGSVLAKIWPIPQQTSNVQQPTLIHKYFDNALLIKFSFSNLSPDGQGQPDTLLAVSALWSCPSCFVSIASLLCLWCRVLRLLCLLLSDSNCPRCLFFLSTATATDAV